MTEKDWKAKPFIDALVLRSGKIGAQALDETIESLISTLASQVAAATKHVESIRETVNFDRTANTLRSKAVAVKAIAEDTMKNLSAAFAETTSALDRESNFDTAFSRALPRELQADILYRYAQSVMEGEFYEGCSEGHYFVKRRRVDRYPVRADGPDWADIVLVCSTWFHIARTDPRFWTAIHFGWPRWKIAKYLALSKNAGLQLAIPTRYDSPLQKEKSKLLMKHINRARAIEFHPSTGFMRTYSGWGWPETPRKPAAVLQLLENVLDQNLAPGLTHLMVLDNDRICTPLSCVSFLSLRTLKLRGCLLEGTWAETLPVSLLELYVRWSDVHVSGGDLFTLLRRCSKLEVLIFSDNTITTRDHDEPLSRTGTSAISVENLRELKPWPLPRDEVEQMFNTCTFNRLAGLNIVLPHSASLPLPTYLSARMARSTSLELKVEFDFIEAIFSDSECTSPNVQYSLEVDFRGESTDGEEIQSQWYTNFDEIIHSFKIVGHLKLHQHWRSIGPQRTSRCVWPSVVTTFADITFLEVGGSMDEKMFAIIGNTSLPAEIPFPRLASLRLGYKKDYTTRNFSCDTEDEMDTDDHGWLTEKERLEAEKHRPQLLLSCLSNRMTAGFKLSRLLVSPRCAWVERHSRSFRRHPNGRAYSELNPEHVERFVDVFEIREPVFVPITDYD